MFNRKPAYILFLLYTVVAAADSVSESQKMDVTKHDSPWLVAPIVSSNPKLGTSGGALAGYLYHFDKQSPVSTFGVGGIYTTTHSAVGALFARAFFDKGRQRLNVFAVSGKVNNDYSDFDNTGYTVKSQGDVNSLFARYLYSWGNDLFIGLQAAVTNYALIPGDDISEIILEDLGLKGFNANGVGLIVNYDSRDNVNTPSSGMYAILDNLAFRKGLGGSVDFDLYLFKAQQYLPHGKENVFAWQLGGTWTQDAPPSAYASVSLRGYVRGQYIAPSMSFFQIEERLALGERWGLTAFAGIACLYGDGTECSDKSSLYPNGGGGLYYMLKPKDKIAATMEYADGQGDNQGFYMRLGWGF